MINIFQIPPEFSLTLLNIIVPVFILVLMQVNDHPSMLEHYR
jgi:hypothetical protein